MAVAEKSRLAWNFARQHPGLATLAGVGSIAVAEGVNELAGMAVWRRKKPFETQLRVYPSTLIAKNNGYPLPTMGVVFQGFSDIRGLQHAVNMHNEFDEPVAYFQQGQRYGVTSAELAGHLTTLRENTGIDTVDVHFRSMGLQKGLPALRDAGLKARIIVCNSNPSSEQNAIGASGGIFLAEHSPVDGGLAGRLIAHAITSKMHGKDHIVRRAVSHMVTGASTPLDRSDMRTLRHTNLLADWESYQSVITPETHAVYVATTQDKVVRTGPSYAELQQFFGLLGVYLDYMEMPKGAVHADDHALAYAKEWITNARGKYEAPAPAPEMVTEELVA